MNSSHPVEMSISTRVLRNAPRVLPPQWATRSALKKPGLTSSQSANVRTWTWCLRRLPDRVVDADLPMRWRSNLSNRSTVAGLTNKKGRSHVWCQLDMTVILHIFDQLGQKRDESLRADLIRSVPECRQRLFGPLTVFPLAYYGHRWNDRLRLI